jgi:hypothetical protein
VASDSVDKGFYLWHRDAESVCYIERQKAAYRLSDIIPE